VYDAETLGNGGPRLEFINRWILSRLASTCEIVDAAFTSYDFPRMTSAMYAFWLNDFCDVYIEMAKPILRAAPSPRQQQVLESLHATLDLGLRMLAPAMPFLSEALHANLPRNDQSTEGDTVCLASYPTPAMVSRWADADAETNMELVKAVSRSVRSIPLRQMNPKAESHAYVVASTDAAKEFLVAEEEVVRSFSRAASITILGPGEEAPAGCITCPCTAPCQVNLLIEGHLSADDIQQEVARLEKKEDKVSQQHGKLEARMKASSYAKVPEPVRRKDADKVAELETAMGSLQNTVAMYKRMQAVL